MSLQSLGGGGALLQKNNQIQEGTISAWREILFSF